VSEADLTERAFHLHPLSVPYRIIERGAAFVVGLVVIGPPVFGSIAAAVGVDIALLLGIVVVGAAVGYAVAAYRRFEYELTADTFDIRSGVFARRNREIPLRRIQNVDISQNVVQRALGIAALSLETAGASGSEANLRFLNKERAERLRSEISRLRRSETGEATEEEHAETVFEISDRELGLLALISADLRLFSGLVVLASFVAPSMVPMAESGGFDIGFESILGTLFGPTIALISFFGAILVYGVINATVYYGFTLSRSSAELRYERGLLQRYSGTIPLEKVQSLTVEENVIARALGYASLDIETAGGGGQQEQGASQSAIPLATRTRVFDLLNSVEAVGDVQFERPPKRARQRYMARYAAVVTLFTGLLFLVQQAVWATLAWWLALGLLLIVPPAAHLKWTHRGYVVGENHVVTRNGFWVRQTKVVPYYRVQTVLSSETVFQRRRHLGTVTVDTAGARSLLDNDARAVDIDAETSERLREQVSTELYESLRRRRASAPRSGSQIE
jgi:putative membrane protein